MAAERNQAYLELQREYAARREANMRLFNEKVDAASHACPELRRLIAERNELFEQGVRRAMGVAQTKRGEGASADRATATDADTPRATATGAGDPRANAVSPAPPPVPYRELFETYNRRIAETIRAAGLPQDTMSPIYTCPTCRDEGFVYAPDKRMCACFRHALNERVLRRMGFDSANPQTFGTWRADVFSDAIIERLNMSQRTQAQLLRDRCERYADAFPQGEPRDLLLMGASGLGKTFLMRAIAARVVERGFDVTFQTAFRVLETARRSYLENNPSLLSPLLDAPLLMIDDLGTEPLLANVTVIQLFNLLNERQMAGRHTVICTNLSGNELSARYTERFMSRLRDKRVCETLQFFGPDVRPGLK